MIMAPELLEQPGSVVEALSERGRELEVKLIRALFSRPGQAARGRSEERQRILMARARKRELKGSAEFLELWLVLSGLLDAARLLEARTTAEVRSSAQRIMELCGRLTGLDAAQVLQRHGPLLEPRLRRRPMGSLPPLEEVLEHVCRLVRAVVAACPIHVLEKWGHELDAAELSHRCRKAYDGLVAFVRRHEDLGEDERMRTVGRAYSEGRLTMEDVSRILQVPIPTAVALLEKYSFHRSVELIRIEPRRRRQKLEAIAQEAQTQARMQPSNNLLVREVIASQRIEGVDARPWMGTGVD